MQKLLMENCTAVLASTHTYECFDRWLAGSENWKLNGDGSSQIMPSLTETIANIILAGTAVKHRLLGSLNGMIRIGDIMELTA